MTSYYFMLNVISHFSLQFEIHRVLTKNCSAHKEQPMIYNLSMFGKIIFVMTINYDVIGI